MRTLTCSLNTCVHSLFLYKRILLTCSSIQDPEHYGWVRRHTWQSWRNRYVKDQDRFDPKIDRFVKRNPHYKEGKGRYRLSRRSHRKRRAYSESEEEEEGEEIDVDNGELLPEEDDEEDKEDHDQPEFERADNTTQRTAPSSSRRPSATKAKEVRYYGEFIEMYAWSQLSENSSRT